MRRKTAGTVELPSGRWDWIAEERQGGWVIVYRHRRHPHDEMRTWIEGPDLSDDLALEAAREPVVRKWLDGWDRMWEVSLDLPPAPRDELRRPGTTFLRFARGGERYYAASSADVQIGVLTREELGRRLREAGGPR